MKKIDLTEKQKKIAIRTGITIAAAGGSYILLCAFSKSKFGEKTKSFLIQKLCRSLIDANGNVCYTALAVSQTVPKELVKQFINEMNTFHEAVQGVSV